MCGRYTLTSVDGLIEEFSLAQDTVRFAPRYNIAPGERIPVIDNRPRAQRVLVPMLWGLVPYWAKDTKISSKLVNARCETVAQKPSFRQALHRRRCIVVADGFYEWQHRGKTKVPYHIHRASGGFMAFAGLWERWRAPDDSWLVSCTVITTPANALVQPIHDRMPLLLRPEHYERWLDPASVGAGIVEDIMADIAKDVVRQPDGGLEAYEVSRLVNSVKNDSPACIARQATQTTLI